MKIAYLVNTYPAASHSFIRREIAGLRERGADPHRFAMRSGHGALVDPADIAEEARTEHVLAAGALPIGTALLLALLMTPRRFLAALRLALRCGGRGARGGWLRHLIYLAEAAYVARRCGALGITHLHAHFGTNSTTVAMLAHALGGPPYSFTTHGPEEFDAPMALALDIKLERAAFAVAVSSFGRSQLCRWVPAALWPRIHVVHCGIEPARFPPPAPLPDGGPHLVAIGRLVEQKGFALLIEAVGRVAPLHPGLRLRLVGDGPLRDSLTAQIASLGLADRVTLTGWQNEAGVRAEIDGAQALILSSFAEGLPVVVMEAMAAGRPVIATAIAGVPELVIPGATGWLVPAGDAATLAGAIGALAATPPATLARMGLAARARALERHDAGAEAARLLDLFRAASGQS